MRKLSLFSGIGGIDLAAHWAGMETVAFCEREPFPQKVLRKHWPGLPIYDDVCTLTAEKLKEDGIIGPGRTIDIISGGYPCQPFSHAGKRQGKEDDRHLWPEVHRLLQEIRPRWFVGENVAGHVTLGLDDVLSDLGDIGYTAQPFVIPSSAVGAPHRRDRVFIVAHSSSFRSQTEGSEQQTTRTSGISSDVAHPNDKRMEGCEDTRGISCNRSKRRTKHARGCSTHEARRSAESILGGVLDGLSDWLDRYQWPAGQGAEQYDWEPPRVATGVKDRVGRLKALGNAVNPVQIYPIMAAIKAIDDQL